MKLWDKGISTDDFVHAFTSGEDRILDKRLAKYDVLGSIAQAKMLAKVGLISLAEAEKLVGKLQEYLPEFISTDFAIPNEFEDIHSYTEWRLTQDLGEIGKKIHTARSRNDQVLVDLHLYYKDVVIEIRDHVVNLAEVLLDKATKHEHTFMPGFTHMQVAMPSSFGMWFSAYAELLCDDLYVLDSALKVVDQNPLGSAAGYGSSFKIDRESTTTELKFSQLKINSIAAQLSRGKSELVLAQAISGVAFTLSKFAMDVVLYSGQNFGLVKLPDAFTTGSSIMPHKKNPDVFELIRARCNGLQSLPEQIRTVISNLPAGYHRDFQELKQPMFNGIDTLLACLAMASRIIPDIKIAENLQKDHRYHLIDSVDRVADLVSSGMSFRDAYKAVGESIEKGKYKSGEQNSSTHIGSVGNLRIDLIQKKLIDR